MPELLTSADILRAVTELAVADMSKASSPHIKCSVIDSCAALIDAGLIPINVAPDVWRCCEIDQQHSIEAIRTYLERQ